jgi:hypothetical protein
VRLVSLCQFMVFSSFIACTSGGVAYVIFDAVTVRIDSYFQLGGVSLLGNARAVL